MTGQRVMEMRSKHRVLAEISYEPTRLERGYNNRWLRVDITTNTLEIRPVTPAMKELWVGGKGFDLWLTLQEIDARTTWDSPTNPICFSPGPLGGTASFPGTGKTLVTAISPLTYSIMDSNVGGYFGPYLKFAGFDALMITGKAEDETIVVIDASLSKVTIERAPLESVDSHVLAEELTEMYAGDEVDRRNIAVVSAGRGAEHTRMGILNFSFYDWRRQVPRLKQAGRGGIGTVFRSKKLKAIVVKNEQSTPTWRIADSQVSAEILPTLMDEPPANIDGIRAIIEKWHRDPEYVIEMMQDIQDLERYVSRTAIDELNAFTGRPRAELFHIATFYKAFSLEPRGKSVVQVCVGTACHVRGSARILEAFERALGIRRGGTTPDRAFSLEAVACLGCCSLAPVVKIGDDVFGNVAAKDVTNIIAGAREVSHV